MPPEYTQAILPFFMSKEKTFYTLSVFFWFFFSLSFYTHNILCSIRILISAPLYINIRYMYASMLLDVGLHFFMVCCRAERTIHMHTGREVIRGRV